MILIDRINQDFKAAYLVSRDNELKKNEKDFLGVLKTEVTKENKIPEDGYVIDKIKSMIKNASETNSLNDNELTILNRYLPKQMTEDDLSNIVVDFIVDSGLDNIKDMGKVMTHLKDNYSGQYDGKLASTIVKVSLESIVNG